MRGQVSMMDEAKLHSPIHSTSEALVVQHVVRYCHGEELDSFCWPMPAACVAVFGATHLFPGRTDAEAPDAKRQLIREDPDVGKDWRQEEKGTTEDEMVGWHHRPYGLEFEQAPGDEGQGNLACCSPCGLKESNMTEWLNNKSICWAYFSDVMVSLGFRKL